MKRIVETQLRRMLSLFLVLSMCVGQSYAAEATATTVQLMKTEGTVDVTNSGGRALTVREDMRLYNGYHVNTGAKSYAWVNLDSDKLTKLDESSEMELRKENQKLEVLLNEGSIYFNVEKPLEDSESMNIRTSTMVVGIRGTCGWVRVIDRWTTEVSVLEGSVQCTVTDPVSGQIKTTIVKGGEKAVFVVYDPARAGDKCDILRDNFTEEDIPGFVLVELVRDTPLCEKIYADSGLDLLPITREEAENRLKADQAEQEKRLEEREHLVAEQERHVSVDPVWKGDTPVSPDDSSGGGGGGTSSGPSGVIRLTMPVTAREVQDYLDIPAVTGVTLLPGSGNNTFSVDIAMTVPGGKTLTLNAGVPARVEAGNSMTVNGTAGLNDALTNLGTVTVNSANTLRVGGNLTNNSTMIVPATGRSITEGTFTNNQTLTLTAGAQVLARTFDLTAPVAGWTVTGPQSDGYYRLVQTQPPHTITFDGEGSTGTTGEDGTLSNLPVLPPNENGDEFDGWYTQPDGGGDKVTEDTIFTEDTTLYPHWTMPSAGTNYTITRVYNDGSGGSDTVTTLDDGKLAANALEAPAATIEGIEFTGWFTAQTGGTQVTTDRVFTQDTTIYAHWTRNVTVTISGKVNMPETDDSVASPVSGATVQLFKDEGTRARAARAANRTVVATATTDSSGTYTLPISVAPGEYTLAADSPGYTAEQSITIAEDTTAYENKDFELSDAWDYDADTKTLTITGNGPMKDYDYVSNLSQSPWVADQSDITAVEISDGVTSIGYSAFWNCSGLTSVTIPDSVTSIEGHAFQGCTGLTSVTISESVTKIGSYAFQGCTSLTSIDIPGSVTNIEDHAFYGCSGLTEVVIPDSVTYIGSNAFSSCRGLTSVTIPDSVTSIAEYAFSGCGSLTSVTIPDSVTNISGGMFNKCARLTSVTIPSSVTSIGYNAFYECSSLTSVTIPDSVTSIGTHAFYGCGSLTSVTIPDSVTSIGHDAFGMCRSLTSVTIPGGVTSIESNTFLYCSHLTSITFASPSSLTSIGAGAFQGCTGLTSVTIPDSVTSIWGSAFYGCAGLTSVTIPNSVTIIWESAFYECSGLTSVTIPVSVTSIGSGAFYNCTKLADIYYSGTEDQWNAITIGANNGALTSATKHYESTRPDAG